jgi:hypothetical protein
MCLERQQRARYVGPPGGCFLNMWEPLRPSGAALRGTHLQFHANLVCKVKLSLCLVKHYAILMEI